MLKSEFACHDIFHQMNSINSSNFVCDQNYSFCRFLMGKSLDKKVIQAQMILKLTA